LAVQAGAAVTIIVWDAALTVGILKGIGLFMRLRLPDTVLESGDLGVHEEEAYPGEPVASIPSPRAPAPAPTVPPPAPDALPAPRPAGSVPPTGGKQADGG
jgi:Amt family ammonium transporter